MCRPRLCNASSRGVTEISPSFATYPATGPVRHAGAVVLNRRCNRNACVRCCLSESVRRARRNCLRSERLSDVVLLEMDSSVDSAELWSSPVAMPFGHIRAVEPVRYETPPGSAAVWLALNRSGSRRGPGQRLRHPERSYSKRVRTFANQARTLSLAPKPPLGFLTAQGRHQLAYTPGDEASIAQTHCAGFP